MNGRTKILMMMTAVVALAVFSSEVRLHVTRAGVIKETNLRLAVPVEFVALRAEWRLDPDRDSHHQCRRLQYNPVAV